MRRVNILKRMRRLSGLLGLGLILTFQIPVSHLQVAQVEAAQDEAPAVYAGFMQTIDSGLYHSCAVKNDGSLDCWGHNPYKQASPPDGLFVQVSAGGYHSCGLKVDGALVCWGLNDEGQASPPGGVFTQVSAGDSHTCGLRSDGSVVCWGENTYGQTTSPVGTFIQVEAGGYHSCGLRSDRSILCWGNNDNGEIDPPTGLFTQISAGRFSNIALESDGTLYIWGLLGNGQSSPSFGRYIQVSVGDTHTCGLRSDGTLFCWGNDTDGQSTPPDALFTQVSAGGMHTCGLKSDGTLACWGNDTSGQTSPPTGNFGQPSVSAGAHHTYLLKGDGTLAFWGGYEYQVGEPEGETFRQVSAGYYNTCVVKSDGSLDCWGDDSYGHSSPPADPFRQVSAGYYHACGVSDDGSAACWGSDLFGQSEPPPGSFSQVTTGISHSCGLKSDGAAICWGWENLGNLDPEDLTPPDSTFTQIDAGGYHNCGVKGDGTMDCWPILEDYEFLTPLPGYFKQASAGGAHTCGLRSDGLLECKGWEMHDYGQFSPPPGFFIQVSTQDYHTCALTDDRVLICWGLDRDGQTPHLELEPAVLNNPHLGHAYQLDLSASGGSAPYSFRIISGELPPGWSLSSTGRISGIPSQSGSYEFGIQAADSSVTPVGGRQKYTLVVEDALSAQDDYYITGEDAPLIVDAAQGMLANDYYSLSGTIEAVLLNAPAIGELDFGFDGSFKYTPTLNFSGVVSWTYLISDSLALSEPAVVTMVVTPVNDSPMVDAGPDQSGAEGQTISYVGAYEDIEGDSPWLPLIIWEFGDGKFSAGSLSAEHAFGNQGTYTVTLTVVDSQGGIGQDELLVTIENIAPGLSVIPDLEAIPGEIFTITGEITDPGWLDPHTLSVEWGLGLTETLDLPAGQGSFQLVHMYPTPGEFTVRVTVMDESGSAGLQEFKVLLWWNVYLPIIAD